MLKRAAFANHEWLIKYYSIFELSSDFRVSCCRLCDALAKGLLLGFAINIGNVEYVTPVLFVRSMKNSIVKHSEKTCIPQFSCIASSENDAALLVVAAQ
jgi:hypothetical protein